MTAKLQDDMNSIPLADDDPQGENLVLPDFAISLGDRSSPQRSSLINYNLAHLEQFVIPLSISRGLFNVNLGCMILLFLLTYLHRIWFYC